MFSTIKGFVFVLNSCPDSRKQATGNAESGMFQFSGPRAQKIDERQGNEKLKIVETGWLG